MTVATFAEFVAEQALGIAIGAVAILAAPKAGPKLAAAAGELKNGVRATLASAPAVAGRDLYERLAGGAQRYGEAWSDLFAEATAPMAAEPAVVTAAGLLATVSITDVVSQAPGRLRLRLRPLVGRTQLAEQTVEALAAVDGFTQVQANPSTGSVLILYDIDRYPTAGSLLEAIHP